MSFFHSNFLLHDNDASTSLPPILHQEFHVLGKRSCADEEINNQIGEDELSDGMGEKKRRLSVEQVKTLEKSFEVGNKLEPERKMQLARALGLQPRQIAIWFQNRRARWKTKQLEKDYQILKREFEAVKAENESLQQHNHNLHAQIMSLKTRREATESINLNKETEGCSSNRSENSSEIKVETSAAIDSNGMRHLFPSPLVFARPDIHLGPNLDQPVKEENHQNNNMFCGMDDQTGFWPWLEHHNFN